MAHIFIITGHGDGDPGATGNGYKEYERVRALAKKVQSYGGNEVTVGDTTRDWYKDNLITALDIPKDWQIVEFHMDGSSEVSARGGHVIIKSGYDADKYDKALAEFISDILPGRAQTIVKRDDLANPKRAAAKGYPYRLVEFGFITNAQDVKIFNENMDKIAKGVLKVFGIKVSESSAGTSKPEESKPTSATGKKSTDTIAKEVIEGKWGNGDTRKKKLEAAGYNYTTIQNRVNEMLGVKTSSSGTKKTLKVGMKAKPKKAVSYDGVKLISSVTTKYYEVIEVKGSRVVLGDGLNTAFDISNLTY